nr:uncharacterized protein LOC106687410 isoform X2 [Halyomorpha halys]
MSSPSAISYPTAIAHAVLSFSSAWAIFQVQECLFAVIGFSLYLINGILGVLAYGMPQSGIKLYKFYSGVLLCCLSFGLPLFVSQLYINNGFPETLALIHFILPFACIYSSGRFKKYNGFQDSVQFLYLLFLVYISLIKGYYFGISSALSFLIAFYVIGPTGTVQNTPSRDLFNYALSFSVYFLIQALRGR